MHNSTELNRSGTRFDAAAERARGLMHAAAARSAGGVHDTRALLQALARELAEASALDCAG